MTRGYAYPVGMRHALLILAVFCAVISGWTPVLAQVREVGGHGWGGHGMSGAMHHTSSARAMPGASDEAHCPPEIKACAPHQKMVHPMLCAACFAVVIDGFGLDRRPIDATTIPPARQRPLLATSIKPRFPPPKAFALFS